MPELPEVETVVQGLRERLAGSVLRAVDIHDKYVLESTSARRLRSACGSVLQTVTRYGKYIVWEFPGSFWVQHLRMTGKMLEATSSHIPGHLWRRPQPSPQLRLVLHFDVGRWVFYDARRFGTVAACDDAAAYFEARRLAPEIFAPGGEARAREHFLACVRRAHRPIKSLLLDQRALLGPGNIYADEALFRVALHPQTRSDALSSASVERLFAAVLAVMCEALAKRGTSMADYLDTNGNPGVFQKYLQVYGRKGMPCRVCATPIAVVVLAGRSSHFCPHCQPEPG